MTGPLPERVAANVRAEAGRRRITRTALAEILKLSRPSIAARLDGHQSFTLAELETLAGHFGIPVSDLLNGGKVAS